MDWWNLDSKYIWHPFTQHALDIDIIPIKNGKGAVLYDVNGNEYIDAIASWWTNAFGHANPTIANAIKQQVDELEHVIFAGFTHRPAVDLAKNLIDILPNNQQKVFFSDNGSTSVEVAIKMAIQYWYNQGKKKSKILCFENAYHGDTFGAMSVGKSTFFTPFYDNLFEVIQLPLPTECNLSNTLSKFNQEFDNEDIAAFIYEPLIQGSAGMKMYEAKYLDKIIATCKVNNILCIADEVMTGFGRTGKHFACNYLEHQPDIFCLSKAITGGFLPLGITSCTIDIYNAFLSSDRMKTLFHGHSYTANPIVCVAANASIKLLQENQSTIKMLVDWQSELKYQLEAFSVVKNLRQLGTIVAFEIEQRDDGYFSSVKEKIYQQSLENGVLLRPLGNTIYIFPPYVISKAQLEKVYKTIVNILESI